MRARDPVATGTFVLRGGTVVDGSGAAPVVADVAVRAGRILGVGPGAADALLTDHPFASVVDATGLEVLPGFIDVHSHDDAALLRPGGLAPKTGQGVTTTVIGNCGLGVAPSSAGLEASAAPVLGPFPAALAAAPSFADYLVFIASEPRAVNTVALVPHAPLRAAVMGFERRVATDSETTRIAGLAADALDAGAAGISLGLMYAPGDSAGPNELEALAAVAARFDRPLVAHIRNEADHLRDSIGEIADLGRATGCRVHISHLKVTGPRNAGTMPAMIDHLDSLRAGGVDITADVYPYDAGSTTVLSLFAPQHQGSLVELLTQPRTRVEVLATLEKPWEGGAVGEGRAPENQWRAIGPGRILVAGFDPSSPFVAYEGWSVDAVATALGVEPLEALADLVVATDAQLTVILFHTDGEGMRQALAWPHTLIGSDGLPRESGYVHPRLFGSFARALTLGVLPRAEAVRRMTSATASLLRISGRGTLEPGAAADLQLIDPATYADRATYESPRRSPAGVRGVWVAGVPDGVAPAGVLLRA